MVIMYFVRGYIDKHPIYDEYGDWNTKVEDGDYLVCSHKGFGSEMLDYGSKYKIVNGCLHSIAGKVFNKEKTKDMMPFFVKLR